MFLVPSLRKLTSVVSGRFPDISKGKKKKKLQCQVRFLIKRSMTNLSPTLLMVIDRASTREAKVSRFMPLALPLPRIRGSLGRSQISLIM